MSLSENDIVTIDILVEAIGRLFSGFFRAVKAGDNR